MNKKEELRKLVEHIQEYLQNLQSGKLGVPEFEDLETAGLLHQFLEEVKFYD